MKDWFIILASTAVCFIALDFAWLGLTSQHLYRPALGSLMRDRPNMAPAVLFYVVYVVALTFLVTAPAARSGEVMGALVRGFVFGAAAYATYNLTNAAVLVSWPTRLAWIDLAWGASATAIASAGAVRLGRFISGLLG